jgi:hypothetical protein
VPDSNFSLRRLKSEVLSDAALKYWDLMDHWENAAAAQLLLQRRGEVKQGQYG